MKDNRKDKFEDFFAQSLKTYGENPSDSVWEELETKIPKPDDKKKPFIGWLFLLVLLLLSGSGFWYQQSSKLQEVNQAIQNQEEKLNTIVKEVEAINKNLNVGNENNINSTKSSQHENQLLKREKSFDKKQKQTNYKTTKSLENIHSLIDSKNTLSQKTISSNNQNTLKSITTISGIELSNSNSLEKIITTKLQLLATESIPSVFGEISIAERKLKPIDLVDFIGPERASSLEIYNYLGTTYPNIKLEDPINIFSKQGATNIDFGLLYNIPMKERWTLQVGMGFTQRTIGTVFDKSLEYGNNETFISNNLFQSKNTYQINSNYGRQIFTSYFTNTKMNDGQDIEAGDVYSANINLIRTQQYFSIPLIVKYQISHPSRKLKWTVKAGIFDRIYFKVNDIGVVHFENISHPRLKHNNTIVEDVAYGNTATRYGFELVLGSGIEYQFHKNLTLIFDPVFKTNILERTSVTPYTVGVYSGVRWTFSK